MYIIKKHTKIRIYIYIYIFPLLSHIISPPKHQAPSTKQVANTPKKKKNEKKKENEEEALKQPTCL